MKRIVTLALPLCLLPAVASAAPINRAVFEARCQTIKNGFNGGEGSRALPFAFTNINGAGQNSSARMAIVNVDNCVANTNSASIVVQRINNFNVNVRVTFKNDGAGFQVSDTISDCVTQADPFFQNTYRDMGYVIDNAFIARLKSNLQESYCPAMNDAVRDALISSLSQ